MLCVPTVRLPVAQVALRTLPAPVSAAVAQPAIDAPPSKKLTVPVGEVPVTVAVKVRFAPTVDGLAELPSVLAVWPILTTCDNPALVEPELLASPA